MYWSHLGYWGMVEFLGEGGEVNNFNYALINCDKFN